MKSTSKGVVSGRPRANSDPRIAQQSRLLKKPHSAPPDIQVFLSPALPIIEYKTETGPADPNDISRTASTAPPRNDYSTPSDPIDSTSPLTFLPKPPVHHNRVSRLHSTHKLEVSTPSTAVPCILARTSLKTDGSTVSSMSPSRAPVVAKSLDFSDKACSSTSIPTLEKPRASKTRRSQINACNAQTRNEPDIEDVNYMEHCLYYSKLVLTGFTVVLNRTIVLVMWPVRRTMSCALLYGFPIALAIIILAIIATILF